MGNIFKASGKSQQDSKTGQNAVDDFIDETILDVNDPIEETVDCRAFIPRECHAVLPMQYKGGPGSFYHQA